MTVNAEKISNLIQIELFIHLFCAETLRAAYLKHAPRTNTKVLGGSFDTPGMIIMLHKREVIVTMGWSKL